MMAAVDANYKFIYAIVGTQGRVSDAGLFAQSDLRQAMDQGRLNFPPPEPLPSSDIMMPYMFVGDEAYPLRRDLMKPYPYRQMDQSTGTELPSVQSTASGRKCIRHSCQQVTSF